jgi:sterol 24-C-methyltransferase
MASPADEQPLIRPDSGVQSYYASLESRLGYRLVLGGTRHFGYYEEGTYWPFPVGKALRAMEDHLFDVLGLEAGAEVLDAGCGVGHVAIHLAQRGLRVQAIDIVHNHVRWAQRNVEAEGLENTITVRKGDYHHLDAFADQTLDGVYTLETFVHATDPEAALAEFFRVLKPGGSAAFYEYDHLDYRTAPKGIQESMEKINKYAAMPSNARFEKGVLERLLEEAGFEDLIVNDLSANVKPMLRLFFILAYLPYLLIQLFGLEAHFINTVTGVEAYRAQRVGHVRYVSISARKPLVRDGIHQRKKK